MTKQATIVCHVPFEGPGEIAPLLKDRGFLLRTLPVWETEVFPNPEDVSFVVLMGGPMSVNDTEVHPWLVQEIDWLRQVLHCGIPVLGVCLGAQLMAVALGGEVRRNPHREIGWWPIEAVDESGASLTVLHWHGETFTLPEGSVWMEKSQACAHQSFRWGRNAIALQYHIESTESSLARLMDHCRSELIPGTFVQQESRIREGWKRYNDHTKRRLEEILDDLCDT
jgi:GMP synthase-like glutamine amidotransferase